MIVSGITPADKRRSKVFLDGSFAFVLYNGEIKRFHIEEGEELAQELYGQIMDEVLCRRARERMLHLLKSTSRTELEIRRKLGEALYPQQAIDEAVAFAKRYHYIDCLLYTSLVTKACLYLHKLSLSFRFFYNLFIKFNKL